MLEAGLWGHRPKPVAYVQGGGRIANRNSKWDNRYLVIFQCRAWRLRRYGSHYRSRWKRRSPYISVPGSACGLRIPRRGNTSSEILWLLPRKSELQNGGHPSENGHYYLCLRFDRPIFRWDSRRPAHAGVNHVGQRINYPDSNRLRNVYRSGRGDSESAQPDRPPRIRLQRKNSAVAPADQVFIPSPEQCGLCNS